MINLIFLSFFVVLTKFLDDLKACSYLFNICNYIILVSFSLYKIIFQNQVELISNELLSTYLMHFLIFDMIKMFFLNHNAPTSILIHNIFFSFFLQLMCDNVVLVKYSSWICLLEFYSIFLNIKSVLSCYNIHLVILDYFVLVNFICVRILFAIPLLMKIFIIVTQEATSLISFITLIATLGYILSNVILVKNIFEKKYKKKKLKKYKQV